jgi:hypothetical protein
VPPVSGVGPVVQAWDNYLFLSHTSFNPVPRFTNVILGNDDFSSIGLSRFSGMNLSTGVSYHPRHRTVPEPSTWSLTGRMSRRG